MEREMAEIDQGKVDKSFHEAKRDAEAGATSRERKDTFFNMLGQPEQATAENIASRRGFEIGLENYEKSNE